MKNAKRLLRIALVLLVMLFIVWTCHVHYDKLNIDDSYSLDEIGDW